MSGVNGGDGGIGRGRRSSGRLSGGGGGRESGGGGGGALSVGGDENVSMDVGGMGGIGENQTVYKRNSDTFTIEGSPVHKRVDSHPTPMKVPTVVYPHSPHKPNPHSPVPVYTQSSQIPQIPESKGLKVPFLPVGGRPSSQESLLVICSASEEHDTGDHQENALRTKLLCGEGGCLRRVEVNRIKWIDSDHLEPAPLTDLLRVHDYTYLRHLEQKCLSGGGGGGSSGGVGSGVYGGGDTAGVGLPSFYAGAGLLDCDTPLLPQSLAAAKRFCGAAILAVDHVMTAGRRRAGEGGVAGGVEVGLGGARVGTAAGAAASDTDCTRVFVIGRPPGHHAGPSGCVPSEHFWQRPDMTSSGFCLLNTVAVAAAYARHQYGRTSWRDHSMGDNPVTLGATLNPSTLNPPTHNTPTLNPPTHNPATTFTLNPSSSGGYTSGGYGNPAKSGENKISTGNGGNSGSSSSGYGSKKPTQPPYIPQDSSGGRAPRIAIIDIDIHHGNGTEEIIRNLTPHTTHLPLPSSWAPVPLLSYKPWLDESDPQECFFGSVHLWAGPRFYPCSGPDSAPLPISAPNTSPSTSSSSFSPEHHIVNVALTPIGPGPWDSRARAKLTPTQREVLCKQAGAEFRAKVSSLLLPRLEAFKPDLMFISAGFDAHFDDMYHFLTEKDVHWVTEQLCGVADRCGAMGVISVLEGGYSLSSPILKPKPSRAPAKTHPKTWAGVAAAAGASTDVGVGAGAVMGPGVGVGASVGAGAGAGMGAGAVALEAEPGMGRGGRQKAKKGGAVGVAAVGTGAVGAGAVGVVKVEVGLFPPFTPMHVPMQEGEEEGVGDIASDCNFAQRPGDGGLVKW
ncbi:histone deacetylase domain-containing protein [Ochromonadaceae sp. CCMP2298]|nr:histone deacetylase domain-containing protein [Ochromonadaceae sp. CCMP2298]